MYQSLSIFQTASAMAKHAGARQAIVAQNVANADTPNYQARRLSAFSEMVHQDTEISVKKSRVGHMVNTSQDIIGTQRAHSTAEPAPNGNSVSLEEEMMNSINVTREHNRALAIYRHAMTVLRTTLGR